MCKLTEDYKESEFIGYKVVAMKDGKHYSPAMGFCYDDYPERIPIITRQVNLTHHFVNYILREDCFRDNMLGRTAAFRSEMTAFELAEEIKIDTGNSPYKFVVKKVRLSVDLMEGTYGFSRVVAGRKIEFLEEE